MGLADDICTEIPDVGDPFALSLPGGLEIQDYNLMKAIQPLLAPLIPLFNIIDAVVALYNCLKAIPDCLGPPPDPTALAQCLPDLAQKIMKLLNLVPILSLPITVAALVDLVIAALREVKTKLQNLVDQLGQMERSIEHARNLNDAGLSAILACAQGNVEQESRNMGKQLASLGKLLGLLDLFMNMIGGPKVPSLTNLNGLSLKEVLAPIDLLVSALMTVREAIPFPVTGAHSTQVL
jgi:hypothetical protein